MTSATAGTTTTTTVTTTATRATIGAMTDEQARKAEQIVRRWRWAGHLSAASDRLVERGAVGELAVALLDQLLKENAADRPATGR